MHAMRRIHRRLRVLAEGAALLTIAGAAAAADKPQAYEVDAGFDVAPQSLYWYSAAITAVNGDIAKSGFLLRTYGSLAVFQYATTAVAGTVDGELWQARHHARLSVRARQHHVRRLCRRRLSAGAALSERSHQPSERQRDWYQSRGARLPLSRMPSSRSRPASPANTRPPSTPTMPSCASARVSSTSSSSVPTRRSMATPATMRSGSADTPSTPSSW